MSRSTYSALFGVTGTRYGSGNGSSTFNVPDTRRRVTRQALARTGSSVLGNAVGNTGGEETHRLVTSEIPSHLHDDGTLATTSGGSHTHRGHFWWSVGLRPDSTREFDRDFVRLLLQHVFGRIAGRTGFPAPPVSRAAAIRTTTSSPA